MLGGLTLLLGVAVAGAQMPEPRITSVFPAGAKAGASGVEISLAGQDLDEPSLLVFSHAGLKGVPVTSSPTPLSGKTWPLSDRYLVDVAGDVPPGVYELRFQGHFGLSNAVAFEIGLREEILENGDHHASETALPLGPGTVVNGRSDAGRADYFRVTAKAGETLRVRCRAGAIDSRMHPDVILLDAAGKRELERASLGAVRDAGLDYLVPGDAEFVVRVADFTGKGGGDYFYRLFLAPEAGNGRHPEFPWGSPELPRVERAKGTPDPMRLNPPCVVEGQWDKMQSRESFIFNTTKGTTYAVEVLSERWGHATDPLIRIEKREAAAEGVEKLVGVGTFDDWDAGISRGRLPLGSRDATGLFVADADAEYLITLTDQFGGTAAEAHYFLRISEPRPDFELRAVPTNPVEGDRRVSPGLSVLRKGGTLAFEVHALRRDGFEGPISLRCEGLPQGVTLPESEIGGKQSETTLVLRGEAISERWDGVFRIIGNAGSGDRAARAMRLRCAVGDYDREEVIYADGADFGLSLLPEAAPLEIRIKEGAANHYESALGGTVEIPVSLVRNGAFNFKGNVRIRPDGVPGMNRPPELNLDEKTSEGVLSIPWQNRDNNGYEAGTYSLSLIADGTISYEPNPEAKAAAEVEKSEAGKRVAEFGEKVKAAPEDKELAEQSRRAEEERKLYEERARQAEERSKARDVKVFAHSLPVTVQLAASPVRFASVTVPEALEAGGEGTWPVSIERSYGFDGEVRIEAVVPPQPGPQLRLEALTIPKDQTKGGMKVSAAETTTPGTYPVPLKAKVNFNGTELESTYEVMITIKAKP